MFYTDFTKIKNQLICTRFTFDVRFLFDNSLSKLKKSMKNVKILKIDFSLFVNKKINIKRFLELIKFTKNAYVINMCINTIHKYSYKNLSIIDSCIFIDRKFIKSRNLKIFKF